MLPTYLFIKQHKITGLKYFGKTTKSDPYTYTGSGKYWKRHIKKYGHYEIDTIWCELFTDKNKLIDFALNFSKENNIVNSKEWANLKEENGLDGGMEKGWWSEESIENFKQKQKQRWADGKYDGVKTGPKKGTFKQSEYQKDRSRESLERAWLVTNPQGQSFNIVNLRQFCMKTGLDQGNMVKVSQGKLKQHKGWMCIKIGR
jgi:hypothetical protein